MKVMNILQQILKHGLEYKKPNYAMLKDTSPKAAIVTCCDSRICTPALHSAEGEFFTIRNIGNSLETALGSVEFAVKGLKAPLLLFLGHTECLAVANASRKEFNTHPRVKDEIENVSEYLTEKSQAPDPFLIQRSVIRNIFNQVDLAREFFSEEKDLMIAGALYDLHGYVSDELGKIHLIQVNDEKCEFENLEDGAQSFPKIKDQKLYAAVS